MAHHHKSLLSSARVTRLFALISAVFWFVILASVSATELGDYLVSKISRPLEFRTREWMGKSPALSSKLKIYAIDDSTFSKMGTWVLTGEDWVRVLGAVAKKSPKAIFIDQLFSKGSDFISGTAGFTDAIKKLGVPVYVGAFLAPAQIRYRDELDLNRPDYLLGNWVSQDQGQGASEDIPTLPGSDNLFVYGPSLEVREAFSGVGHLMYDGTGTISPLIRVGQEHVVPHMTTFLAKNKRISTGRVELDGKVLPLDSRGRQVVNFAALKDLQMQTRSMRGLLSVAQNGGASTLIQAGDVVLILPLMYTGNTDFKATPLGNWPAGWVIASQLSSGLTQDWLRPISGDVFYILLMALLGAVMGSALSAIWFWTGLSTLVVTSVSACLYLFIYHSLVIPWLLPISAGVSTALTVFARRSLLTERKTRALRQALEGVVPARDLQEVLKHPDRVSLEPRERVVTIMFIDVVGFSLIAERMLPRAAFENLKSMLARVGETVHEYGGVIDKTLGDGLLCYFGYRFDRDTTSPDHAEKALLCARKIQEENILRNIHAAENDEPVYPLRIGINTASCYLGDLGSESRIDFTLVGNGVNFAKRLEGACEMHSVLLGSTTYDLVRGMLLGEEFFSRRLIQIKHHSELVEAYEFDPFVQKQDLRKVATQGFRKCVNVERVEIRRPVPESALISVSTDFGNGRLVNFSQKGLALSLPQLLAKGTRLNIILDTPGGALRTQLQKESLDVLHGEVRWGYSEGDRFVHGIAIGNLTEPQGRALLQTLIEFVFAGQKMSEDNRNKQNDKAA